MRMSKLFLRTLRDAPADAEAASHQLLVRAGYIRRLASGVYTYLPLGRRVLQKAADIVRQEMDASGAQELSMPILQPVELWEQSGRRQALDDAYAAYFVDGRGGHFVLGPTHEEVITAIVAAEVDSYRDLPLNLYQIQTKFRDEARPRFGLLRGREFLMKDAYSFDADYDGMRATYTAMYDAYCRIFDRCGLTYTPVEAEAGAFGGDVNHEFMVPSAIGEDHFARCTDCDYSANLEVAEGGSPRARHGVGEGLHARDEAGVGAPAGEMTKHHTPDRPGIDLVVEFFADRGLTAAGMLKCLALVDPDGKPVVALVPGDRDVRVPAGMRPFEQADFDVHPELVKGYIGPMGLADKGVRVIADMHVTDGSSWVTGANDADHHVTDAVAGRDFEVGERASLATVAAGDPCPRCETGTVELVRSVEAGHVFQLGLRYTAGPGALPGATFSDENGEEQPFWMGCYGVGVSRILAVVAEEHHDDAGLIWPEELAPFAVQLLSLGANRSEDVAAAADKLYDELTAGGIEVLYDDRDLSPGVKFADADLIGVPVQLVVGAKGLARGVVERKSRKSGERDELPLDSAARQVAER